MSHIGTAGVSRRLRLLLTVSTILIVVFLIRLIDFQIVRAEAISELSYENRAVSRTVEAKRGDILDSNGNVLATSVYRYDINAAPAIVRAVERNVQGVAQVISVDSLAAELASILGEDVAVVSQKLSGTSHYVNLKKRVDAETHRRIVELQIPWIFSDAHQSRLYPNGAVAGNLLGFVDVDGVALAGIERQYNSCLAGVDGQESFEKGVDGIRIPSTAKVTQEVVHGRDVVLTIDSGLQYQAQQVLSAEVEKLNAEWAAAVVIEVKTGKIVLAAEAPSVDPNDPAKLEANQRGAKVFQFAYEPGSTMKALTAATAIDKGFATVSTGIVAPDSLQVFDATINDFLPHKPLKLTLAGVLMNSSNVGMIKIAENIPASVRFEDMQRFGFGKPTEIGFEGETFGVLNDYKSWDGVSNFTTMFGQALSVSPVQMTSAYQALANDGVRLPPTLIESCISEDGSATSAPSAKPIQVVSSDAANDVMLMLEKIVEEGVLG
jgi:cell division protein FtsI (penicillin-binding protein 3)